MKVLYVAPEAEIIRFVAVEQLTATDETQASEIIGGNVDNKLDGDWSW